MTTVRAIGVDIGGTKIAAGYVDQAGLIGAVQVVATEAATGAAAVLARAVELARSLVSEPPGDGPSAIGIASGGWVSRRLGRVLGGLANTLDPELIIVGGGAAAALGEPFLAAVRSAVAESVLPSIAVQVVASGLGPSASVIGAGLVALDARDGTPGFDQQPT